VLIVTIILQKTKTDIMSIINIKVFIACIFLLGLFCQCKIFQYEDTTSRSSSNPERE